MYKPIVYVASSWKNPDYDTFIDKFKINNPEFDILDFKTRGRVFSSLELTYEELTNKEKRENNPTFKTFKEDMRMLNIADILVLLLPCGKSAHIEYGYACGKRIPTYVILNGLEMDLFYLTGTKVFETIDDFLKAFKNDK